MPGRLMHKAAIITGGGSGIGLESALLFASEGANVVLADVNIPAVQNAVSLIEKEYSQQLGVQAFALKADVSKDEEVKALVDFTVAKFGRLDVMLNNAGIVHPADNTALNIEEKTWDLTMNINAKGVWYGSKYAIVAMHANKPDPMKGLQAGGSIINVASVAAIVGSSTPHLAYTASKGAVLAMSRELAMTHAREGIRVNALCPGPINTPLLLRYLDTPEKRGRPLVHLPLGRFGEAIEQAHAALFLASDESSYITGADFKVDGGLSGCYATPLGEQIVPPPVGLAATLTEKYGVA